MRGGQRLTGIGQWGLNKVNNFQNYLIAQNSKHLMQKF